MFSATRHRIAALALGVSVDGGAKCVYRPKMGDET